MATSSSGRLRAEPFRLYPGTPIPRSPYTVRGRVGSGGMGEIYFVTSGGSARRLALKVLREDHLDQREMAARLREEARLLRRLVHPHIAGLRGTGVLPDGRPYFAMEWVEGRDLGTELRRFGVLAVPTALSLARQTLRALAATHAQGIVHRDVKLDNLMLDERGHLWLIDFGIARDMHRDARITAPDLMVGTPRGMAPEQFGPADVDERTDVYALGLVLYEMLVGSGPFDTWRGNVRRLRAAQEGDMPLPPSQLAPQLVPPDVDRLVLRALAKRPTARFPSADAMALAISELGSESRLDATGPRATTRRSPAVCIAEHPRSAL